MPATLTRRPGAIFIMLMLRQRWSSLDEITPHTLAHSTVWRTLKLWPVKQGRSEQVLGDFALLRHLVVVPFCEGLSQSGESFNAAAGSEDELFRKRGATWWPTFALITHSPLRERKTDANKHWYTHSGGLDARRGSRSLFAGGGPSLWQMKKEKPREHAAQMGRQSRIRDGIDSAAITRLWQIYRLALSELGPFT